MIIYFAGVDRAVKDIVDAMDNGARHFLISYHYRNGHKGAIRTIRENGGHIMLDSGAFSAWKQGVSQDLDEYIRYIKENQVGKYITLDVVGDPEQSAFNLQKMRGSGLHPIPVFHMGSDFSHLDRMAAEHKMICLGGTVGASRKVREQFFQEVFTRYPDKHFHGLGLTSLPLMKAFPWFSVDSTTWLIGKKNFIGLDPAGKRHPLPLDMPVTDRVAVNVKFFSDTERDLYNERFE